jgi:putative endonuclease
MKNSETVAKRNGRLGEEAAREYLKKEGYKRIAFNYTSFTGEIDIIAVKKKHLAFIEVKTRTDYGYGYLFDGVKPSQAENIKDTAYVFRHEFGKNGRVPYFFSFKLPFKRWYKYDTYGFDLIEIYIEPATDGEFKIKDIIHTKNAF